METNRLTQIALSLSWSIDRSLRTESRSAMVSSEADLCMCLSYLMSYLVVVNMSSASEGSQKRI